METFDSEVVAPLVFNRSLTALEMGRLHKHDQELIAHTLKVVGKLMAPYHGNAIDLHLFVFGKLSPLLLRGEMPNA